MIHSQNDGERSIPDEGGEYFSEAEEDLDVEDVEREEGVLSSDSAAEADREEEGEDLFGDATIERDYAANPELDRYDPRLLDESSDLPELSEAQRRRAEREMERREGRQLDDEGRSRTAFLQHQSVGRIYSALEDLLTSSGDSEELELRRLRQRKTRMQTYADKVTKPIPKEYYQAKDELPFCDQNVSWTDRVSEIMQNLLRGFFWTFRSDDEETPEDQQSATDSNRPQAQHLEGSVPTYISRINQMVQDERRSLPVEWHHISRFSAKVCDWLVLMPLPTLAVFSKIATELAQTLHHKLYSGTSVSVRLKGYHALDSLRGLRTHCLNQLIVVEGVVVKRTGVQPKLKLVYLECVKCGYGDIGPFEERDYSESRGIREGGRNRGGDSLNLSEWWTIKTNCARCKSKGPFNLNGEKTVYENYQRITLQESPGSVRAGMVPRQKEVIVLGDLVECARPGEEVLITGVYFTKQDTTLNARTGFPIFGTEIHANDIVKKKQMRIDALSDKDVLTIKQLSQLKNIREKIIDSIAPSIWGMRFIKAALAYAMFGGVRREAVGGHCIRGDINVLLLGDAGMGKSQFLKYVEKTFDRTIYTTGKGASALGLTASIKKDPRSGEWALEAGALVLADEGICLIDEFDKMSARDRVSIHEAMEQQCISISKAGFVANLKARCAVIAAANPIFGKYEESLPFLENVDLGPTIMSRFDILAVVKDQPNAVQDEYLARHVVESHSRSHPNADPRYRLEEAPDLENVEERYGAADSQGQQDACWKGGRGRIPQQLLQKYIFYARQTCFPELHPADESRLASFYSEIRKASSNTGGLPITVRHLESVVRMAVANAKMRLAKRVSKADMNLAIGTMIESFIQSQKHAIARRLGRQFGRLRALAASPDGFIEEVLTGLIESKGRGHLQRAAATGSLNVVADAGAAAACLLESTTVSYRGFKAICKNLYDIPEVVVYKYLSTPRFSAKFWAKAEQDDFVIGRQPLSGPRKAVTLPSML